MAELEKERSLEETPTWAVAVVCFVLLAVSIVIERMIHLIGKWLARKHKRALVEALEKIKSELMLLGFLSFLLTVLQGSISDICISKSVGATWHPCKDNKSSKSGSDGVDIEISVNKYGRKLLEFFNHRRRLAVKGNDYCTEKGKVAFVSAYGIHQLHMFIFVLAVFHVLYCILTLGFGRYKMRKWKVWEKETRSIEYQYYNDPERFRFARDTSFGRRHLNFWSKSPVSIWIVSFFRQFCHSVTKVDYLTLRHGFIMAHLAPGSESTFDFQKYISKSLEEDFKVIVEISPVIWFSAVLFMLSNTYGWHSYLWLPIISLIIVLLVGTKLLVIITKMGLRIQERGDVVKGAPLVQPGDHLFWFGSPRLMLFLIHFVFFQNAFQLAFFAWSTYEFGINSCFHKRTEDIVIRLSMGVIVQVLCSYVTLPLYALVTQMGSTMKPTIFNEGVAAAVKKWHHKAKKKAKHSHHSPSTSPFSSMPPTPTQGMSPVHLLHNHNYRSNDDGFITSPRGSNLEMGHWGTEGSSHSPNNNVGPSDGDEIMQITDIGDLDQEPGSTELVRAPRRTRSQHEIDVITLSNFSFGKGNRTS